MRNRLMRNHDILRLLLVLLLILCLCLPGCGSKLPDGGSLTSVAADEDSSLYLDVSGKDVDAGKLSAAIRQGIEHNSVMRPVDNPDEKTLVVKVEVRDMFQAGTVGFSPVGWLGSTVGGALAGLAFGALVGAYTETSALLGAGVGMVVGVVGGQQLCPGPGRQGNLGRTRRRGHGHGPDAGQAGGNRRQFRRGRRRFPRGSHPADRAAAGGAHPRGHLDRCRRGGRGVTPLPRSSS